MDTYATFDDMAHNPSGNLPEWTLGDRLRKIRRDRHMTQEEFAGELGIKAVTLAAWESGRNHPEHVLDLAVAIERRFDVPAAWTLGVLNSFDRRGRSPVPEQRQRRCWSDAPSGGMMACTA